MDTQDSVQVTNQFDIEPKKLPVPLSQAVQVTEIRQNVAIELPEQVIDVMDTIIKGVRSTASKSVYQNDLEHLQTWMHEHGYTYQTMHENAALDYRSHLETIYAKATVQRMLTLAKMYFSKLVKRGLLASHPFDEVKGVTLDNETTHKALSLDEVRTLMKSIDTSTLKGQRDYTIIMLLIRTGLRRAECVALNIGDITVEDGHNIAIVRHGKGDKRRKVKLPVDVFRSLQSYIALRTYAALDTPLFTGFSRRPTYQDARISVKVIERIVYEYGLCLGYDDAHALTPHDLRATFITLALDAKASLIKVQYAVGHADARTTQRYHTRKLNLDDNAVDYIKL